MELDDDDNGGSGNGGGEAAKPPPQPPQPSSTRAPRNASAQIRTRGLGDPLFYLGDCER